MALLAPLGGYADEGFDGLTWYYYRDTSLEVEGKGTFENPIVINTPEQLAQLSFLVNEKNNRFTNQFVVLGADISLNKIVDGKPVLWVPIGYYKTRVFEGIFLGTNTAKLLENGEIAADCCHTISDMHTYVSLRSSDCSLGLFGNVRGYLGHFSLKNINISYTVPYFDYVYAGLVCGYIRGESNTVDVDHGRITIPNIIENVYAEGKITNRTSNSRHDHIGGIAALCESPGIVHCAAKCDITTTNADYVGGICGLLKSVNDREPYSYLQDCVADVNIKIADRHANVGGIVGCMHSYTCVQGCSSSGIIEGGFDTGGICGYMHAPLYYNTHPTISACTSGVWVKEGYTVGGILGEMGTNYSGYAGMVSHCTFSGYIEENDELHPTAGICGSITKEPKEEHITKCLMTGTIKKLAKKSNAAAIVSHCNKPEEIVSNCYYDSSLFQGKVAGEKDTHATIKGLTTEELTSADLKKLQLLDINEEESVGFTLRKGYYPMVYTIAEWPGYNIFETKTMPESQVARSLFNREDIDKSNTVYKAGAWLNAVPLILPKGDAIYDLVSQISVNKSDSWSELTRSVSMQAVASCPEDADFLEADGSTIKVTGSGSCVITVSGQLTQKVQPVFGRPDVILPSKVAAITATLGTEWDGSIATAYAAGTGIAEDPFIIKNGAQLALAVTTNEEGQWFKQLCDITIIKNLLSDDLLLPQRINKNWIKNLSWKGRYNGDSHSLSGFILFDCPVFGNVEASGEIANLAVLDSHISMRNNGTLAYKMNGKIVNCIVQGSSDCLLASQPDYYNGYTGGICSLVGPDNPDAVVEDCVSAMFNFNFLSDYTPLVSINSQNKGKVRNCLVVVPVAFGGPRFETEGYTMDGHSYIEDCYWLKGYEPNATGYTLEEINNTLGKRQRWTVTPGFFPMLKSFENTDYAKMLSVPVRTDIDYDEDSNYLLGFRRQLQFEPANVEWVSTDKKPYYLEIDSDMGIMAPIDASFSPAMQYERYEMRSIAGLIFVNGAMGQFRHHIPLRTGEIGVNPGITFKDENARKACLDAFDTDGDGNLMLSELKAVTNQQTLSAFQTATAKKIKHFPEFRFFKSVTKLTTQLNNLSELEDVRLPYALKTIGSDAFMGCTSLKEVTVSQKVSNVEPHAFFGSAVENIKIDPFNENFKSQDGVLFDANRGLVAYPNGRSGEEITISGVVSTIFEGAFYHIDGLKRLYLDFDDYVRIIPELEYGGIETTDGSLIDVYVKDASDGGIVLDSLMNDYSWEEYRSAHRLHRYYPVTIDNNGFGSFYIGFDTELPQEITPYTVPYALPEKKVAFLRKEARLVPKDSPVIVYSQQPGTYRLMPYEKGTLTPWNMYENRLNATGANGIAIYAEDSYEGGIYTLQHSDLYGTTIFNFCQEEMLPPYHAYLPYNSIADELDMGVVFVLAPEIVTNDMRFFALPDMEHRTDSVAPAYNNALLTAYEGGDGDMETPRTIQGDIFGQPVELAITALAPNIFAQSNAKLNNINLSLIDNLQFYDLKQGKAYATLPVNRQTKDSPFYKVDENTFIFLSRRGDYDVQGANVIEGDHCRSLIINDGHEFLPRYAFNADSAFYRHSYAGGKAYPVIMPFAVTKPDNARFYKMLSVNEDLKQFVFTNVPDDAIEPSTPYLMVVDEGTAFLYGNNTEVHKFDLNSYAVCKWMPNPKESTDRVGYWTGTFATVSNAAAQEHRNYILQSNGHFTRVGKHNNSITIPPFTAFVEPWNDLKARSYEIVFQEYYPESDTYATDVAQFPASSFTDEYDITDSKESATVIWSEQKQTLYFTGQENDYEVGDTYNDAVITALWTNADMLDTGDEVPEWTQDAYARQAKRVVFDKDFESYHPQSLYAWFKGMSNLTAIDGIEHLNTDQATNMASLFEGCSKLTTIDVGDFIVSNLTNLHRIFANCSSLTTIFAETPWIIQETPEMFEGCNKLVGSMAFDPGNTSGVMADYTLGYFTARPNVIWCQDDSILYFDTPHRTLEAGMEWNGHTITSMWKADKVVNVGWSVPEWAEAKKVGTMPEEVRKVVITEEFAVQRPKSLYAWFYGFRSLESIEGLEHLNTSQVDNMNSMFMGCSSLKTLNVASFDMTKVSNVGGMFRSCKELTTIYCDQTWRVRTSQSMFFACTSLVGATAYNRMKTDGEMANPVSGYFTYLPVINLIDLADNSAAMESYAGQHVNVRYDRTLSAIDNGDGTWTSRAFTACVPFDIDVSRQVDNEDDVELYQLASVSDKFEFIFVMPRYIESPYGPNIIEAGKPYVIVVNRGTFRLEADNIVLKPQTVDIEVTKYLDDLLEKKDTIGYWKGTFHNISNADAAAMKAHTMSNDGKFRRISDEKPYQGAYIGTFRAFFSPFESDGFYSYKPMYSKATQGEETPSEEGYKPLPFPADTYEGDCDFPDYDNIEAVPFIHTVNANGIHRYFDLMGRPLKDRPSRGLYIDQGAGKKLVKKP